MWPTTTVKRPAFNAPLRARVAMALAALSGDEQGVIFVQLCNVLDRASPWP